MSINWERYGIKAPYGRSGNRKVFCPQCHDQRHDKRDKSLSINLETGEFNCHYCGFSGCAAEKELGKKKTARGATPPPYAARNPFTRNPPHVRTVLQSQGKPLNGSRDGVSAKRP